jgi:hypothetical protein
MKRIQKQQLAATHRLPLIRTALVTALLGLALGSIQLISAETLAFALIGDMPYTSPTLPDAVTRYQRLIDDVNNSYKKVKFTIHIGDIKAGTTLCEDKVYTDNKTLFNSFADAAVFLPGDNEWTDCHRSNNGGYNPLERLSFLRSTFYTSNLSLGAKPIVVTRQAGYPENVMWTAAQVLFVAINMPGSNNNHQQVWEGLNKDGVVPCAPTIPYPCSFTEDEYNLRNAANLSWLAQAFALAASSDIKGVLIAAQANPFERFIESGQNYKDSGYAGFVASLRSSATTLGKPVVYVNGDTHYFRIDRPLTGAYPNQTCTTTLPITCTPVAVPTSPTDRVDNFTRVEVFGQNDVHWVRGFIDTDDPKIFTFAAQTVTGN